MSISSLIQFAESLLAQAFTYVFDHTPPPAAPVVTPASPKPDMNAILAQLIENRTIALGPMPGTGGVVHRVTPQTAAVLAPEIIAAAKAAGIRLSLLQALLDGESKDDAAALDPNLELDTPGETADQKLEHEDVGIAQIDVSTAKGFADLKGLTDQQIVAKLLDPEYGITYAATTIAKNISDMKTALKADPMLAKPVLSGYNAAEVLGLNAYNSGYEGTIISVRSKTPNLAYGLSVVKKAAGWAPILDVG